MSDLLAAVASISFATLLVIVLWRIADQWARDDIEDAPTIYDQERER